MPFWLLCSASKAILSKMFQPSHPAGVFIWEKFHPSYRDLGRKNRDLSNWASPASHMNTSILSQRKEWRGAISETEPAQLTRLIRRGLNTTVLHCSCLLCFIVNLSRSINETASTLKINFDIHCALTSLCNLFAGSSKVSVFTSWLPTVSFNQCVKLDNNKLLYKLSEYHVCVEY